MNKNPVDFFEIPVSDMERAIKFYNSVFEINLSHIVLGPLEMALFPGENKNEGTTGSLVKHKEFYKPSSGGILLYFTAPSGDLSEELSRVEMAGGKVVIKKRLVSDDFGYMALINDSEGNRIALHSKK
jgi:predicted enzyme related to lactoylglutathione lyase